jgi:hypothetical protein
MRIFLHGSLQLLLVGVCVVRLLFLLGAGKLMHVLAGAHVPTGDAHLGVVNFGVADHPHEEGAFVGQLLPPATLSRQRLLARSRLQKYAESVVD